MARRLWFGDWQRDQEVLAPSALIPEPAPTRRPVRNRTREKRSRAWTITLAVGAGVFAWSFGFIFGEVRNGSDPGLQQRAAAQAVVQPQQQAPEPPPLTTRQS